MLGAMSSPFTESEVTLGATTISSGRAFDQWAHSAHVETTNLFMDAVLQVI